VCVGYYCYYHIVMDRHGSTPPMRCVYTRAVLYIYLSKNGRKLGLMPAKTRREAINAKCRQQKARQHQAELPRNMHQPLCRISLNRLFVRSSRRICQDVLYFGSKIELEKLTTNHKSETNNLYVEVKIYLITHQF
jgi:hypothetical protein